jgi:hypothetical protein
MTPISEHDARELLAAAGSQAASAALFDARREDGGWAFSWADKSKPAPTGIRTIVVTDAGRLGRVKLGESAGSALERLAS